MTLKQFTKSQARALTTSDERVEFVETRIRLLSTKEEFAIAISEAWSQAQRRFLMIGRYLVQARERLEHGEYSVLIERELPFNAGIAYQLRAATEAIDRGRITEGELPPNYSIIYQISTLDDKELLLARQRGIIRPDVSRREVQDFKRQLRALPAQRSNYREGLRTRRTELINQLARLQEELLAIDAELAMEGANETVEHS